MILPNQAQHSSFACFGHCFSKALSTIFNSPHRRSVHMLLLYSSVFLNLFYFPLRVNSSFLQFQTQKGIERSNDLLLFFSENKNIRSLLHPKMHPPPKTKFSRLLTSFNHFSCVATPLSYSFCECLF